MHMGSSTILIDKFMQYPAKALYTQIKFLESFVDIEHAERNLKKENESR